MRLRRWLAAPIVVACVGAAAGSASASATEVGRLEAKLGPAARSGLPARVDRLLVRLRPGTAPTRIGAEAERLFGDWYRLRVPPERRAAELARLAALAEVERVEADVVQRLDEPPSTAQAVATAGEAPSSFTPDDPLFPQQWHHRAVQAEAAWGTARGEGALVAVVDSGISRGGHDLACAPFAGEYDAVDDLEGEGVAADVHGHGTFIGGIVAQCTDNGVGAAGLAHGARLLVVRACTEDAECASSDVARGIDWATSHGADVVTLSLGFACDSLDWPACSTEVENDAIARAAAAGVIVVAIAGNAAQDHVGFPANHPEVIGVGGVDARLFRASYSSWGEALSLVAPSGDTSVDSDLDGHPDGILQETLGRICIPAVPYAYCRWQGTSFAGPHVAAAAALLRSRHPGATRDQVRRALEDSALDRGAAGFDPIYGHGVLQTAAALDRLDEIVGSEPPPPCQPSAERLCLRDGRYAVSVSWLDFFGGSGTGHALPLTGDSGLFWFFVSSNLEMLVKVLDGCGVNGRIWVFAAGTTDVAWELVVVDTLSGAEVRYSNELGTASPAVTDTGAFACDPAP
ncbi:MAG: S8 family serine peptidase [Acidobacteria bacterium]|nr:S8 family serine peptidase [Acidobacteriota bacterium]